MIDAAGIEPATSRLRVRHGSQPSIFITPTFAIVCGDNSVNFLAPRRADLVGVSPIFHPF
jgi:hypothetical protein